MLGIWNFFHSLLSIFGGNNKGRHGEYIRIRKKKGKLVGIFPSLPFPIPLHTSLLQVLLAAL
jgi:hypothetical protein